MRVADRARKQRARVALQWKLTNGHAFPETLTESELNAVVDAVVEAWAPINASEAARDHELSGHLYRELVRVSV